ncbi:MAG: hypothetical protein IJ752_00195 [Alphaproteobacteria bacterium]|nr:hypothetical protein [Alphaproteobacteria bacterium]
MTRKIIAGMLCGLVLAMSGCFKEKTKNNEEQSLPEIQQPNKVLDYLALSAHFLINQQQPDGFFKYEYDFITGNYTHWDNVIHQTRAGYALIQYYIFLVRNNIDSQLAAIVLSSATKALQGYSSASVAHNSMPGKLISFYYNKSGISTPDTRKISAKHRVQRLEAEVAATALALITEISYWSYTSDTSFAEDREQWRTALIYHAQQALKMPAQKNPFMPYIWQAFAIYAQFDPSDKEINELLPQIDAYFTTLPRYMKDVEDYTWDMIAANQRFQSTQQLSFVSFAARQTTRLLEDMYTQHDTTINSCGLSLGLVEASLVLTGQSGDYARIEQTALGRSQLEYYSSLKYTILPNQAWIALGPGRTLHSQDFKRFAGASVFGMHMPRTNIGLIEMCLLTGMRFSNEDIKELKQKTGKE